MNQFFKWSKRSYNRISVDIKDLGAKGESTTDDTEIIQRAVDLAYHAGGGIVLIPPLPNGNYYRITRPIWMRDKVTIRGTGYA